MKSQSLKSYFSYHKEKGSVRQKKASLIASSSSTLLLAFASLIEAHEAIAHDFGTNHMTPTGFAFGEGCTSTPEGYCAL